MDMTQTTNGKLMTRFGGYAMMASEKRWAQGRKVRCKIDIVTKGGLICKAGDETTIANDDVFEGSAFWNHSITIFGTRKDMEWRVSVDKSEVEFIDPEEHQCSSCGRIYNTSLCEPCGYVRVKTQYGPVYIPIEQAINGVLGEAGMA